MFEPLIGIILDMAADAIVVINKDSDIIWFNRKFLSLFGYTSNEVKDKKISIIMPQSMEQEHINRIQEYIKTKEKHSDIIGKGRQVLARNKNNEIFPVYISVGESVVNDEIYFIGIVHDTTINISDIQGNLDATKHRE